jgi:putative chitinase
MKDKQSAPSVIASYRKRQERVMRFQAMAWILLMILIVAIGAVVYTLTRPDKTAGVVAGTGTPAATTNPSASQAAVAVPPVSSATQLPFATITPAPSPTESQVTTYVVQLGDTLGGIAFQRGVDVATLQALNPQITPEFLNVGDKIVVPKPTGESSGTPQATSPASSGNTIEYQVVSGDTLGLIADRFGSTINAIVQANNLSSPDEIQVGQRLQIPILYTPTPTSVP